MKPIVSEKIIIEKEIGIFENKLKDSGYDDYIITVSGNSFSIKIDVFFSKGGITGKVGIYLNRLMITDCLVSLPETISKAIFRQIRRKFH